MAERGIDQPGGERSTDSPGSGIASYQRQVSTDGGASWGSTSTGASRSVTAEGETLVRFRAVDVSGKTSNWVVATARIDRTKPTDPNVSSAGAGWQNTTMLPLSASGSSDSGGSGLVGYQSEMSTNGAPYTSPVLGASVFVTSDGVTVVRFRSIDGAGNTSAWSQVTAEAGFVAAVGSDRDGRVAGVGELGVGGGDGGRIGRCLERPRQLPVADVHGRRCAVVVAAVREPGDGDERGIDGGAVPGHG